jgi:hypothetical protein
MLVGSRRKTGAISALLKSGYLALMAAMVRKRERAVARVPMKEMISEGATLVMALTAARMSVISMLEEDGDEEDGDDGADGAEAEQGEEGAEITTADEAGAAVAGKGALDGES